MQTAMRYLHSQESPRQAKVQKASTARLERLMNLETKKSRP